MSFARPTLTTLIERAEADINARLAGADSRLRRSVLNVLARIHAGGIHGTYGYLDYIANQILPDAAEGGYLERWSAIFGVQRKAAQAATGMVLASGANGSVIPAGAVLVRADGIRFVVTTADTITGGAVNLAVEAEATGTVPVTVAGQPLTFSSPIGGVSATAIVNGGIIGGAGIESDAALRERLMLRIRQPPSGGSVSDYRAWALQIPEVSRAWVYPSMSGLGTVGLAFVMDGRANIIPTPIDVATVQAHIDSLRPVTADVTVFAPTASPIIFRVELMPDTTAIRTAVQAELRDLIAREAEPGGTLLISHIREAVSIAAGEIDHRIVIPSTDIIAPPGAIFTYSSTVFL